MIKMERGQQRAWVAPKHVEQLLQEGWTLTTETPVESEEIKVKLKPAKRSKR